MTLTIRNELEHHDYEAEARAEHARIFQGLPGTEDAFVIGYLNSKVNVRDSEIRRLKHQLETLTRNPKETK